MVVVNHLYLPLLLGQYAVFGFYIVSGYLMTLVMQNSYGYGGWGRARFAINRILRLFPMYWFACLLTILLIQAVGEDWARSFHRSMFLPANGGDALRNLLLYYPAWHPNDLDPRLVPPSWALTVELFFYGLICLGISKTGRRVALWFGVSLFYFLVSYGMGLAHEDRYFPIPAASLPFSMGSALYFMSRDGKAHALLEKAELTAGRLFVAMLANTGFWMVMQGVFEVGPVSELGFYINMLLCTALVFRLANGGKIVALKQGTDEWIGDFSYPIYLLHWQAGLAVTFLMSSMVVSQEYRPGLGALAVSVLVVICLSLPMIYMIDRPMRAVRNKIKV